MTLRHAQGPTASGGRGSNGRELPRWSSSEERWSSSEERWSSSEERWSSNERQRAYRDQETATHAASGLDTRARSSRVTRQPDDDVWAVAATVVDPEIPVLTIEDLGVLRDVHVTDGAVDVTITPTYSGCPAMDAIRDDVVSALTDAGYTDVRVHLTLSPAWTTDWMSEAGKAKLQKFGIAAPTGRSRVAGATRISIQMAVKCPQCNSLNTHELAHFGSTSCKALYECRDCLEPFDYFKVL